MTKKTFRILGLLEALSIIALFGIAMPMKYWFTFPEATRIPGLVHGILFLGYIGLATQLAAREQWSKKQLYHAYLAGVAPLGTLVFDWKYLHGKER